MLGSLYGEIASFGLGAYAAKVKSVSVPTALNGGIKVHAAVTVPAHRKAQRV